MSKAFTRESDDLPDLPPVPRPPPPLPPGAKNYLTPEGAARLRAELERLLQVERPRLAALPEDSEAKRQLQMLDQRIRHLQQSLQTAVVVPPPAGQADQVRFGATVTVRTQSGEVSCYRIVGIDEIDLDRNWVSWLSPIAKALLNARIGQRVQFKLPSGEEALEIRGIAYE
ncbi:MAG: GreA/GreB family elongation factor [Verrucomicrobia bacterium]|nr:GreA/GreB family elongation factor [Verrucomicrobiota bacterium]